MRDIELYRALLGLTAPWTVAGADAIIALRCCKLSGRFEDFWERRAQPRAAA